jgi:branched-chain amino acid transport system permease protein
MSGALGRRSSLVLGAVLVVVLALVPAIFSTYFTSAVAAQALVYGLGAVSLTFLAAYGGIVSLAQTGLYGIAGFVLARFSVINGMDPLLAAVVAIAITVVVGLAFGAIVCGSEGIYLLMITLALGVITFYFFSQVPTFGGHEGINGVSAPGFIGDPVTHPTVMYEVLLGVSVVVYIAIRLIARTNFGLAMQGVRDGPTRMRALGYNVRLHRTLAFTLGAVIAAVAGVLGTWNDTRISPGTIQVSQIIQLMTIAVIGGLYRIEGAWIGALVYTLLDTYTRGLTARFETWIGIVLLVILVLSPDGLTGLAQRLTAAGRRWRNRNGNAAAAVGDPGSPPGSGPGLEPGPGPQPGTESPAVLEPGRAAQ